MRGVYVVTFTVYVGFIKKRVTLFLGLPVCLSDVKAMFITTILNPFCKVLPGLLDNLLVKVAMSVCSLCCTPMKVLLNFIANLICEGFRPGG